MSVSSAVSLFLMISYALLLSFYVMRVFGEGCFLSFIETERQLLVILPLVFTYL